jgi:hypothetical protein
LLLFMLFAKLSRRDGRDAFDPRAIREPRRRGGRAREIAYAQWCWGRSEFPQRLRMFWRVSVRRVWWSALRPRASFFRREIITYTPLAPTHHPRTRSKAGWGSKEVAQAYALATPNPSHNLFLHNPHASSKPDITSPHARFASRSRSRRSQSPRSMNSRPSVVRSDSRFHSCSCSLEVRKRRAAFVVVCRLMCSVSETLERCWRSSRVERVR